MTAQTKRTWNQILHQLPTAAVLTVMFASGGWKNSIDQRLQDDCNDIIQLHAVNIIQDDKTEALEDRVVELEAIARERWMQIQSLQANQSEIRTMVREMYNWMLEDKE